MFWDNFLIQEAIHLERKHGNARQKMIISFIFTQKQVIKGRNTVKYKIDPLNSSFSLLLIRTFAQLISKCAI